MEMGQAVVASRVSGWLLSDFPGMTSLSGGVHACAGKQCSEQVLAAGQVSELLNTELFPVYAVIRKGLLVLVARRGQLEADCVEPLLP